MDATRTLTNRLALSVTAASVALGAFVALDAQPARADGGQRLENFEIQHLTSSYNQADVNTTAELDSNGGVQMTEYKLPKLLDASTPKVSEFDPDATALAVAEPTETTAAGRGNVEYTWKIEDGER